ncbi:DMT family transporter [Pampinifervens florentissimum]|uniref:DMT family transporter n=1 Tax=Pampinifervens florentissimum TaxID=1632019 RepID=UPI0013B48BF9|nr:DMT family transporter [Hydrogenobacter sp. T-8]QID32997.1 DMT family transporter [Hydrogenobacter sp. T-8]
MLGLSLALLSSIFWGTNDYLSKRLLIKGLDENFTLWVRFPIAFLLLTPLGILYWDFNIKVLTYALIWLPLEVLGGVFFIKGLKYAPLSVAMSFYSFMPVFSALFGWLILSEEPSPIGMLGMSLVIFATLILVGFSPKEFFKKNRGVVYMILSTVFFGFNVVIGKASIIESNSLFFSWFYTLCMSFGTLVFVKPSEVFRKENYKHWEIPLLGFLFAVGDALYNLALLLTLSSYVASAERLSLLIAILYGKVLLKEETKRVVFPALLMIAGNTFMAFD